MRHPKFARLDTGVESRPVNELASFKIDKKREAYAYYNARRGSDQNNVDEHLKTMKYYDKDGTLVEEPCLWEYSNMTIIGM